MAPGQVELGLILTSVAILIEAQREEIFDVSVFVVVSAVVVGFDGLRWLVASVVDSDWISVVDLALGRVDFGLMLTSIAILIEAQREEGRNFTSQNTCYSCGCQLIYARNTTAFANPGFEKSSRLIYHLILDEILSSI